MQCLILVRRHHSELFNKKFIYFFSGKLTLILEYLSSGPDAERWLKAFEDPLASIYIYFFMVRVITFYGKSYAYVTLSIIYIHYIHSFLLATIFCEMTSDFSSKPREAGDFCFYCKNLTRHQREIQAYVY